MRLVRMHPVAVKFNGTMWTRKCPDCGELIYHQHKPSAVKGHFDKRKCKNCQYKRHDQVCYTRAGEVWKTVPDFPKYAVSNHGRIKNVKNNRLLKPLMVSNRRQYVMQRLYNGDRIIQAYLHHLIAKCFDLPKPDDAVEIDHINGNPLDNSIKNLRWISHHKNRTHAAELYKQGKGMKQGRPFGYSNPAKNI